MDATVSKIINKALDGGVLDEKESAELLRWDDLSDEAAQVRLAGRRFSERLLPKAEIHGQIGLNIGLCPKDCKFCSFAASNKVFSEASETPMETVVDYVELLEEKGANAVYLMTTAGYDPEKFLEYGRAAKKALKKATARTSPTSWPCSTAPISCGPRSAVTRATPRGRPRKTAAGRCRTARPCSRSAAGTCSKGRPCCSVNRGAGLRCASLRLRPRLRLRL